VTSTTAGFSNRGRALARTRRTLRLVPGRPVEFAPDFRKASLDLLESKGHLFIVDRQAQPLGPLAILPALQNFQDRGEVGDSLVGALLDGLQPGDLCRRGYKPALVRSLLAGHRNDHRFQRIDVVRQVVSG